MKRAPALATAAATHAAPAPAPAHASAPTSALTSAPALATRTTATAATLLTVLALSSWPLAAQAQGTWLQTQCLRGAGDVGTCRAAPAWGQTGVEHVLALSAAAGPGNLGLSLVKPETLPAANAARAQLAAVMLGYLDSGHAAATYRWFGPVAPLATGNKPPSPAGTGGLGTAASPMAADRAAAVAAPASATPSVTTSVTTSAPAPASTTVAPAAPLAPVAALQPAWLAGALGDDPVARSAGWWLASPYLGLMPPVQVDNGADPYRVLRFLAAQCPQLEGKVAPNAWTRCTTHNVPEPGSAALALLALGVAAAARGFSGKR